MQRLAEGGTGHPGARNARAAGARLVERYGADRLRALLACVDVVFGSAEAIAAAGPLAHALAVETLGAAGARAEGHHVRPPRVVEGDTLGAGDAFAAAFLLARVDGAPVVAALQAGCAAGFASGEREEHATCGTRD